MLLWLICPGLWALDAIAQPVFMQPGFQAVPVISNLPAGLRSISIGDDGNLYGIVEQGTGNTSLEDNSLYLLDVDTASATRIGEIAFTDPTTSNLYRIVVGPGGSLTSKLYIVDWINGPPARIDRIDNDLTGHETIHANTDGDPVGTLTSNITFSTGVEYLEAGYFGAQGLAGSNVYRFGITPGLDPILWADPPGSADIRGIAFAPGGAWDDDLYIAQSTVLNGFDDAPGELRRLHSDGVGNYAAPDTVIVSEASGLLEFAREIVFDTSGFFEGDLLYLQADSQLKRVTPAGAVSDLATNVGNLHITPSGVFYMLADNGLYRVEEAVAVPTIGLPAAIVMFLLLAGIAAVRTPLPKIAINK